MCIINLILNADYGQNQQLNIFKVQLEITKNNQGNNFESKHFYVNEEI